MFGKVLSKDTARAVYNILVECAGADESWRSNFVHHATHSGITEYRFQGALGFGGKYYDTNRVSCYPEDMNDERRAIINETNLRLSEVI